MANEAVIIELLGNPPGRPISYTVENAVAITKGAILKLVDPRTASGANITTGDIIAGIAAADKVASDGATTIACYTDGIFDLTSNAGNAVTLGAYVAMIGANLIRDATGAEIDAGKAIGRALEAGSTSEVINVRVRL